MTEFASLCVLSYNRLSLLRDSLTTLIQNAGAPYELIVHDDGSPDDDLRLWLRSLVDAGVISTLIENPPGHNQGQGVALNRMFSMAKGDPIIKLDHDLIYKPNWLARVFELLQTNAEAGNARGRAAGAPAEPEIGLLGLLKYEHDPVDWRKTLLEQFVGWSSHTHILGSGFALTRSAWRGLGPFEEHSSAFAEDAYMQRRVHEHPGFVNALADDDFVVNVGMGYGPSTVNVSPGNVQPIHEEPYLHGR